MKITTTEITKDAEGWKCTITDGNGIKVRIEGMETKAIARQQAKDRIKELRKSGLLK